MESGASMCKWQAAVGGEKGGSGVGHGRGGNIGQWQAAVGGSKGGVWSRAWKEGGLGEWQEQHWEGLRGLE